MELEYIILLKIEISKGLRGRTNHEDQSKKKINILLIIYDKVIGKISKPNKSWIMLDSPVMELFKENSIIPSVFKLRNFVSLGQLDLLWWNSFWSFHYF